MADPSDAATADPRLRRSVGRLARLSFDDADQALRLLCAPPLAWWDLDRVAPVDDAAAGVIAAIGRTAAPDQALDLLARLAAAYPAAGLPQALTADAALRARLLPLLAVSPALAEHLLTDPDAWQVLAGTVDLDAASVRLHAAVGADAGAPVTGTGGTRATLSGAAATAALRQAYRRELVALAGRDLSGELDFTAIGSRLADLAGWTLQAALAVAAAELPPGAAACRLAIIAMGKTGGRELNYVSDVDVVFVADADGSAAVDAALRTATTLAGRTMRICRDVAWEVDAALRPEGKDGPLVRTLASHEAYYQRWASTWEFQALLKARPIAGDPGLGARYQTVISPLVWSAAERPNFVQDVQAMRRRVVAHLPSEVADRELKLGPGGLRDVEFAVQLLQLVHGRGDESLRTGATLAALRALRDGGYVGRDDALSLADAYVFLRTTEHRLQLRRLHRTHLVPDDAAQLRWLARAMGFRPDARGDARAVWQSEWALHAREVRRLHEKLFYRPLLEAVARVPSAALRLTPEEAGRRLSALGFADPARALQHLDALTSGLSRRATLQRALLPVLLSDFADAPDPDAGLFAYRMVSDALGTTPWYLRLLRDEGKVASRLAFLLGTSRYVGRLLGRAPEALRMLATDDELAPRSTAEVVATMREVAERREDPVAAVAGVRGVRRTELLRTAFADLLGLTSVESVAAAITTTTDATLEVSLHIALRAVAAERGLERPDALPLRFAIIALGRLGGSEVGYGSDADVLFVFEPVGDPGEDVTRIAQDVAGKLRSLLSAPSSTDPPLGIDADLRPEGRNGPLVRSLASYAQYYERWSSPWEAQALLRARFGAGDAELGARFVEMVDAIRYPADGVRPADLVEIRRIKARVDAERLPRGADPSTHTKLGRGGLTDIEWTVQLLQLQHAGRIEALRTPRTLSALSAAVDYELLTAGQAERLATAWRQATRLRNAIMLVRDRAEDQIPSHGTALVALGRALGYPAGFDPGTVIDDYRRAARRARKVVEQVFYAPLD